jgi:WD40 repeat protein
MTFVDGSYPARGHSLKIYDLEQGTNWPLPSHGNEIGRLRWHPSGEAVISSGSDGIIRVSTPKDERTHLLYGHVGPCVISVDPNGKWIASAGNDQTVRLWPMPDVSKPPFHTLPYDELMSRLKSMTNYRVVEDDSSSTGYRIHFDKFPGWENIPEW